ncbi:hypothetical protein L6452_30886 [Arctium lappa]|uniref:Uncharacterized protein n=1 Tax=Arctium lappa TaxID=4217 RepID=A0ACB8ZJB1_ARCLA|nr:hypothetical protein L6452_30886 [Arctium lappa]
MPDPVCASMYAFFIIDDAHMEEFLLTVDVYNNHPSSLRLRYKTLGLTLLPLIKSPLIQASGWVVLTCYHGRRF